jgi:proteasome accessory factor C
VRTFRLDRVSHPRVTNQAITHGADDVKLPDTLFEGSADDLIVTIDVAAAAAPLLADYIPDGAVTVEKDGRLSTSVRVSHYHGLKRLIASMPGVAVVTGPPDARRAVAEWAAEGAARYS